MFTVTGKVNVRFSNIDRSPAKKVSGLAILTGHKQRNCQVQQCLQVTGKENVNFSNVYRAVAKK